MELIGVGLLGVEGEGRGGDSMETARANQSRGRSDLKPTSTVEMREMNQRRAKDNDRAVSDVAHSRYEPRESET